MRNLLDFSRQELAELVAELGEPSYRAAQVWQWIWHKGVQDFSAMSNLSKKMRERLADAAYIRRPEVAVQSESADGTIKFLLRLEDGEEIETVLLPEPGHFTQCISTQVGCALGCRFCSTGKMGFTRNLTPGEIAGQVLVVRDFVTQRAYTTDEGRALRLRNLVFMGMGEPLMNLDAVLDSLRTLTDEDGMNFSPRRITVSTVGLPEKLPALGKSGLCSLAVSLHAPNQELREILMPKAGKIHLDELMAALDAYPLKSRQRITYEYALLAGVNDGAKHVKDLARLLGGRKGKINLLLYNPPKEGAPVVVIDGKETALRPPSLEEADAFMWRLRDKGLTATIRKSKGQDIEAACGQLKAAAG